MNVNNYPDYSSLYYDILFSNSLIILYQNKILWLCLLKNYNKKIT